MPHPNRCGLGGVVDVASWRRGLYGVIWSVAKDPSYVPMFIWNYFAPAGLPLGRDPCSLGLLPALALMALGSSVAATGCGVPEDACAAQAFSLISSDFLTLSGTPCASGWSMEHSHAFKSAV